MKLVIKGTEAIKNQKVKTFDGQTYFLVGWTKPHKASSSGRVYVKKNLEDQLSKEFFPSVIGAKFQSI